MCDDHAGHPNVNFLIKTMMQRAPHKRRVKLVQKHLQQVEFDLGDSEEDSDFDIGQHQDDDSDEEMMDEERQEIMALATSDPAPSNIMAMDNIEDDDKDENVSASDTSNKEESNKGGDSDDEELEDEDDDDEEEEEEDEDDEDEDDDESEYDDPVTGKDKSKGLDGILFSMETSDEDDEDYVPQKKKKKSGAGKGGKSKSSEVKSTAKPPAPIVDSRSSAAEQEQQGQGQIKVVICCVCLSDKSADEDEIVVCDNCGVAVHEGCYGISDNQSLASTESSASTEPWFCDACKAGAEPHCELCPNSGGIYKETDAGKWVHIVCALYTPGVAFGDVDRLCPVTLFEMSYNKWGAKECSLCEDVRFSRTGVCISCDAGLCRSHFHVTCAQREGLLIEADPGEVMDIADPFFAYCKQHVDKASMRARRRHWLAIQSNARSYAPKVIEDRKEQLRFERKLNRHQEKYAIAKSKRPPSWVPTEKMVRHLHTSPHAVRGFMRKAELMGVNTHAPHEKLEARKKPHITPALTSEFIQYYFARHTKIDQIQKTMNDLSAQNVKLIDQMGTLRTQLDSLVVFRGHMIEGGAKIRRNGEKLWNILADVGGKSVTIPEMFRPRKRQRSPSKKETVCSPSSLIHKCGICLQTTDQHLLAKCDSCCHHFHLGCLDPPLTRMPKKSKLFGWQCSQCVTTTTDDSEASAGLRLIDEPRRLREIIKEPIKFRNMQIQSMEMKKKVSGKAKTKKKPVPSPRSQTVVTSPAASTSMSPSKAKKKEEPQKSNRPSPASSREDKTSPARQSQPSGPATRAKKENKGRYPDIMCVMCNLEGEVSDTVRCDECQLFYHLACLEPPMKKSPKVRGYAWHCAACDTDLSASVSGFLHHRRSNTQ